MEKNQHAVFQFLKKKESFFFESNKSKIVAELPRFHGQIFYWERKEGLVLCQGSQGHLVFVKSVLWNFKKCLSSAVKKFDSCRDKSNDCEIKVKSMLV